MVINSTIRFLDLSPLLPYNITFYFNEGGILRVDNMTITNSSSQSYFNGSIIELVAIAEGNLTYGFNNFTWNSNSNVSNPYDLTITSDLTVWCYFGNITNGIDTNGSFTTGFLFAFMVGSIMVIPVIGVVLVVSRR